MATDCSYKGSAALTLAALAATLLWGGCGQASGAAEQSNQMPFSVTAGSSGSAPQTTQAAPSMGKAGASASSMTTPSTSAGKAGSSAMPAANSGSAAAGTAA